MQLPVILVEVDLRSSVGNEAHTVLVDQLRPEELVVASCARIQIPVDDALLDWTVAGLLGLEEAHGIEIERQFGRGVRGREPPGCEVEVPGVVAVEGEVELIHCVGAAFLQLLWNGDVGCVIHGIPVMRSQLRQAIIHRYLQLLL